MPDHVHAFVCFPETDPLSRFMNEWKRSSSAAVRKLYESSFTESWCQVDRASVWQPRYYGFNVFTRQT